HRAAWRFERDPSRNGGHRDTRRARSRALKDSELTASIGVSYTELLLRGSSEATCVFRGIDRNSGRQSVIKVARNGWGAERVRHEIDILEALSKVNAETTRFHAQLVGFDIASSHPWLAVEHIGGAPLFAEGEAVSDKPTQCM